MLMEDSLKLFGWSH